MTYGFAAVVILLLITFSQYVTLRMENGHLTKQLDDHLKSASESIRDLESKLEAKAILYATCIKSKDICDINLAKTRAKVAEQQKTINDNKMELKNAEKRELDIKRELRDKKFDMTTLEEEKKSLNQKNMALEETVKKCEEEKKAAMERVSAETSVEKESMKISDIKNASIGIKTSLTSKKGDEDSLVKGEDQAGEAETDLNIIKPPSKKEILDAELPDVDPAAVKVERNDMKGNVYHRDEKGKIMPIILNDDPNAKRAKPEHSVLDEIEKKMRQ